MKPSIPEGAVLTVSPPRRPSLGKLPGAPSLRAAPARSGCALPARTLAERRRRTAARRPATPALRVRPRLGGPWPPSPAAWGVGVQGPRRWAADAPAGGWREDPLPRAAVSGHAGSKPRGSSREAAGVAGQQRFFWNAGCGPLTQQKRNESARVILTNELVHCRLRRNFPFLIYMRLRSLLDFFFLKLKPLTTSRKW